MPNIIAHMMIGAEADCTLEPAFLLGCTLPDFRGMYRDYRGATVNLADFDEQPQIAHGIRVHLRTDSAYDALPEVRVLKRVVRSQLRTTVPALGSGAVRACADAGTDILLDGVLLDTSHAEQLYDRTREAVLYSPALQDYGHDDNFVTFIQDYFKDYASYRYQDADAVAAMLERRFACRRGSLLAFDHDHIPAVARVLAMQAMRLRGVAQRIVTMTAEHVAYDSSGDR